MYSSQLSIQTTKRKGWSGKDLSFWLNTLVQRRGRKGVRADLMSWYRHFMDHGQTLTLTHAVAGFHSHKMTMNLGSETVLNE